VTRRRRSAIVATLAVAALAAAVTLVRLGQPPGIVFDETYYVDDARSMLASGVDAGFAVHPPFGKWVVAAGTSVAGDGPFGWRLGGALLAIVGVAATVELGRRLTGRLALGVAAGVLVALDGVWLTLARLAMLDSTLAALVTLGTLALVVDHQRATSRASDRAVGTGRDGDGVGTGRLTGPSVSRWPLALAGALFGLAAATKWSGLLALGGAGLLAGGWAIAAARRRGTPDGRRRRLTRLRGRRHGWRVVSALVPVACCLVVIPVGVYAASWVPWLVGYSASSTAAADCPDLDPPRDGCDPSTTTRVAGLVRHHEAIWRFHQDLDVAHPYRAPATTWPTQHRPVVAFYEHCDADGRTSEGEPCLVAAGRASEVLILGNPALWWSALALVPLSALALRRRESTAVVPLVLLGAQFVPWLVVARPVFSFYTAPLVPALALAVVIAGAELDRPARRRGGLLGAVGVGAVAGGVMVALGAATPTAITAAVLGATAGAIGGSELDRRRERRVGVPPAGRRIGTTMVCAVVTAAVAVFVYLSPLWLAIPLDDAALRRRWWLPSWV
jgi:dolichyl-phosphate-mannose-protein mannosyltransferase